MKYKHVHTNKYIQIHKNQSVAINLMKVLYYEALY